MQIVGSGGEQAVCGRVSSDFQLFSNVPNSLPAFDDLLFPDLGLLEVHFTVTENLEMSWYHGPAWNALFRHLVRKFIDPVQSLASLGLCIHPVETGCLAYQKGDSVHIYLSFPFALLEPVCDLLRGFNTVREHTGKLGPYSLRFKNARCLVSGKLFREKDFCVCPLNREMIVRQVKRLVELEDFSLLLSAPLRLKSPTDWKKHSGHTFLDFDFFQVEKNPHAVLYLLQEAAAICSVELNLADFSFLSNGENLESSANICENSEFLSLKYTFPVVSRNLLSWQDISYGTNQKTFGGLTGQLFLHGRLDSVSAFFLVAAGYLGLGKNRSFGFGFFRIPELADISPLFPRPGKSLVERIFSVMSLQKVMDEIPNSSPGPDGLTLLELKSAGIPFLELLSSRLLSEEFSFGECQIYQKKKETNFRMIALFNMAERIVHRSLSDFFTLVVESLLYGSCFAFRPGKNRQQAVQFFVEARKEGFSCGIKADIADFFAALDTDIICSLVAGLFPFDSLADFLKHFFSDLQRNGIVGLPQGCSLSPVLSNLYLDRFDRQLTAEGYKLIRYADDFLLLLPSEKISEKSATTEISKTFEISQFSEEVVEDFKSDDIFDDGVFEIPEMFDISENYENCEPPVFNIAESLPSLAAQPFAGLLERVEAALRPLSLRLNLEKTFAFDAKSSFSFLGFRITPDGVETDEKSPEMVEEKSPWLPLFREDVVQGLPVYLTSLSRAVRSDGANMVITDDKGERQSIAWTRISRIVVVGRASFSSGILYRAVKESVPVTFLDIMGRPSGYALSADYYPKRNFVSQKKCFADSDFCLGLARQCISAKIHNSQVILWRNGLSVSLLKKLADKAAVADSPENLRGLEGSAARIYFQSFAQLVEPFSFVGRQFYPAPDPVNAMLFFGYTLLYNHFADAFI